MIRYASRCGAVVIVMAALLSGATPDTPNPWKESAAEKVRAALLSPSTPKLIEAFDAAYRADDWAAGLRLVDRAEQRGLLADDAIVGRAARALWRAGRLGDAAQMVDGLELATSDLVSVQIASLAALSSGDLARAASAADRLDRIGDDDPASLLAQMQVRLARQQLQDVARILARLEDVASADRGYPDLVLDDEYAGVAAFFRQIGPAPVNQVTAYGYAEMRPALVGLPRCRALINGKGPFNVVIDTGGSIVLSIDTEVAEDIGLEGLAPASVSGVTGTGESQQALVDTLALGGIRCERVMARIFDVRQASAGLADAILGLGVLDDVRVTLDFAAGRLTAAPSSRETAAGIEAPVRLVGDAKLVGPVTVNDSEVLGFYDSGADAIVLAPSLMERLFGADRLRVVDPTALGLGGLAGVGGVGGGALPVMTMGPGVNLGIAGRAFRNTGGLALDVLDELFGPVLGVQADVLIGMPVFREAAVVTIDYPERRMWFAWLEQ